MPSIGRGFDGGILGEVAARLEVIQRREDLLCRIAARAKTSKIASTSWAPSSIGARAA